MLKSRLFFSLAILVSLTQLSGCAGFMAKLAACRARTDFDFELLDGSGHALYPVGNEIGITGRTFKFGVSARTIDKDQCTKLVPFRYIYEWNGKQRSAPINNIAVVAAGRTSPSGWSGFLTIKVFYQEVRIVQNPQKSWETHQQVRVMTEPVASRTYTVYFW